MSPLQPPEVLASGGFLLFLQKWGKYKYLHSQIVPCIIQKRKTREMGERLLRTRISSSKCRIMKCPLFCRVLRGSLITGLGSII